MNALQCLKKKKKEKRMHDMISRHAHEQKGASPVHLNLLATNNWLWSLALSPHLYLWISGHIYNFTIALPFLLLSGTDDFSCSEPITISTGVTGGPLFEKLVTHALT